MKTQVEAARDDAPVRPVEARDAAALHDVGPVRLHPPVHLGQILGRVLGVAVDHQQVVAAGGREAAAHVPAHRALLDLRDDRHVLALGRPAADDVRRRVVLARVVVGDQHQLERHPVVLELLVERIDHRSGCSRRPDSRGRSRRGRASSDRGDEVLRAERHPAQRRLDRRDLGAAERQERDVAVLGRPQAGVAPAAPAAVWRRSRTASSSNTQLDTTRRVSGLSGLCSKIAATPPGPQDTRHLGGERAPAAPAARGARRRSRTRRRPSASADRQHVAVVVPELGLRHLDRGALEHALDDVDADDLAEASRRGGGRWRRCRSRRRPW